MKIIVGSQKDFDTIIEKVKQEKDEMIKELSDKLEKIKRVAMSANCEQSNYCSSNEDIRRILKIGY